MRSAIEDVAGRLVSIKVPSEVVIDADSVRTALQRLEGALEDVARRFDSIKIPPAVVIDVDSVTRSLENLRGAVEELLQKAGDTRWERASESASSATLRLTSSINDLRSSLDSVTATAKEVPRDDVGKSKWWPFRS